MAPHPNNPRLPIWHTGAASQTLGSAVPVADDEQDYHIVRKYFVMGLCALSWIYFSVERN